LLVWWPSAEAINTYTVFSYYDARKEEAGPVE
jgi:hypothetical protein